MTEEFHQRLFEIFGFDFDDDSVEAIKKKWENPAAGRLVFLPWSGGSLCLPKVGEDKGGADDS